MINGVVPGEKIVKGLDMPPENAEMPFIAPITRRSPRDSRLPMRAVTSWAAERLPLTPFHPYHTLCHRNCPRHRRQGSTCADLRVGVTSTGHRFLGSEIHSINFAGLALITHLRHRDVMTVNHPATQVFTKPAEARFGSEYHKDCYLASCGSTLKTSVSRRPPLNAM